MSDEILIIDPDRAHSQALAPFIERRQFDISMSESMEEALPFFDALSPHSIVIADPQHLEPDSVEVLQGYKANHPSTQIIITSSKKTLSVIMEKMGLDVLSYLEKPVNSIALDLALKQARHQSKIEKKLYD